MSELFSSSCASSAKLSDCGRYRYTLHRRWGPLGGRRAVWVALNPSTADASHDDPTIRRMRFFAERGLCTEMVVVNLFALRATDPRELWKVSHADRVGSENRRHLQLQAQRARATMDRLGPDPIICAWGAVSPPAAQREFVRAHIEEVCDIFAGCSVWCLGTTKSGMPRHPLYLPKKAPARQWSWDEVQDG